MLATAASGVTGPGSPLEIWQHIVADFSNLGDPKALAAFGSVLMIDLVLAGDNAIVVGALAAGLPADQRKKVILIGIGASARCDGQVLVTEKTAPFLRRPVVTLRQADEGGMR